MSYSELASRYAKALYQVAAEGGKQDHVFSDLRQISQLFLQDSEIHSFIQNPLVKAEHKEISLQQALKSSGVSDEVTKFILLLSKKNRLHIFAEIVDAFQDQSDSAHGVTRGTVQSPSLLSADERKQVEETVAKVTGKQVILSYIEDKNIIGGLVAQVGSYTFDDSLTSHLSRIKDDLNRRAH